MFKVESSKTFRRKYAKLIANNQLVRLRVDSVIEQLKNNPWHAALKTHKVNTPKWGEAYSSRATGDIRIIWRRLDKQLILILVDIGGHSGSKTVY